MKTHGSFATGWKPRNGLTRGPNVTAKMLGVDRETMGKLNSPIDVTLLRRFAKTKRLEPGEPLWEMLSYIGEDLIAYVRDLRARIDFIARHAQTWTAGDHEIVFLPRTEEVPDEPSTAIERYVESIGRDVQTAALVYPDRRNTGYGLPRHNDDPRYDFTRMANEPDVHFAHARGFVAKTTATEFARLQELLRLAKV